MAQFAHLEVRTVNEAVRVRVAILKARQNNRQLRPIIKAIDDAFRAPRDPDGSLHIDPRDCTVSSVQLIDVQA